MSSDYDAIVVGGGHNGLVAAAYLARVGARTVVLERRYKTGGAATTEAPWADAPDMKVTRLSLRDEPHAADDHQLTSTRAPRLQGLPDGALLPGFPRRRVDQDLRRRRKAELRGDRKVVEARCRGDAEVGCLAERSRRRARAVAPDGSAEHRI